MVLGFMNQLKLKNRDNIKILLISLHPDGDCTGNLNEMIELLAYGFI